MGSKQWEKNQPGPDWTDVSTLMSAIETMHGVGLFLTLSAGDTSGALFEYNCLVFRSGKGASVVGNPALGLSGAWPCVEHRTLEACIFSGLYKIDALISEHLYKQKDFLS